MNTVLKQAPPPIQPPASESSRPPLTSAQPSGLRQPKAMDPLHITIAPDGTARCLWTEAVPLHELGHLHIQRAFAVEFDNRYQAWRVFDAMGDCLYCSPSREACLDWERKHLNRVLQNE